MKPNTENKKKCWPKVVLLVAAVLVSLPIVCFSISPLLAGRLCAGSEVNLDPSYKATQFAYYRPIKITLFGFLPIPIESKLPRDDFLKYKIEERSVMGGLLSCDLAYRARAESPRRE